MPRSSGVYFLPPIYLAQPGTEIRSEQHNAPLEDIAQALTNSLPRDGQAPMLADLPMNGRRVVNVGDGVSDTDAATVGQIPNVSQWMLSVSELSLIANQIVYATGPTTSQTTTLTGFGRSLIDDADAGAARDTLGLGTMATRATGTGGAAHRTNTQNDDRFVQQSRTVSSGTGLTGGGNLGSNRTLALDSGSIASLGRADSAVQPARSITAGNGLTGGGNLSANRTLAADFATREEAEAGTNYSKIMSAARVSHVTLGSSEQRYREVSDSRSAQTVYQNTSGRPMTVTIHGWSNPISNLQVSHTGTGAWVFVGRLFDNSSAPSAASAIIPHGHYYRLQRTTGAGQPQSINFWTEFT